MLAVGSGATLLVPRGDVLSQTPQQRVLAALHIEPQGCIEPTTFMATNMRPADAVLIDCGHISDRTITQIKGDLVTVGSTLGAEAFAGLGMRYFVPDTGEGQVVFMADSGTLTSWYVELWR